MPKNSKNIKDFFFALRCILDIGTENLELRHSVSFKSLSFPSFRRFLKALHGGTASGGTRRQAMSRYERARN